MDENDSRSGPNRDGRRMTVLENEQEDERDEVGRAQESEQGDEEHRSRPVDG